MYNKIFKKNSYISFFYRYSILITILFSYSHTFGGEDIVDRICSGVSSLQVSHDSGVESRNDEIEKIRFNAPPLPPPYNPNKGNGEEEIVSERSLVHSSLTLQSKKENSSDLVFAEKDLHPNATLQKGLELIKDLSSKALSNPKIAEIVENAEGAFNVLTDLIYYNDHQYRDAICEQYQQAKNLSKEDVHPFLLRKCRKIIEKGTLDNCFGTLVTENKSSSFSIQNIANFFKSLVNDGYVLISPEMASQIAEGKIIQLIKQEINNTIYVTLDSEKKSLDNGAANLLVEVTSDLKERTDSLNLREDSVRDREMDWMYEKGALQGQKNLFQERLENVKEREKQISHREDRVNEREIFQNARDAELSKMQAEIAREKAELKARYIELEAKEAEIVRKEAELNKKWTFSNGQRSSSSSKSTSLSKSSSAVAKGTFAKGTPSSVNRSSSSTILEKSTAPKAPFKGK